MSAETCEKCGTMGKTYWVSDKEWLCARCFKKTKQPHTTSISQFACGLQLPDEDEEF